MGYTLNRLADAVLTSAHNLCFGAKIRKKNRYTPAYPVFYYIKGRFKGVYIARTCFPDELNYESYFTNAKNDEYLNEPRHGKPTMWFLINSDTPRAVLAQKMTNRGWKFWI